jgi:hypothetical protein
MARRFVVELLDALAEVGLGHLNVALFEEPAQVAFLGQHRLALDERFWPACRQDIVDNLIVLGGVARPIHLGAVLPRPRFELLEIVGKAR